MKYKNKDGIQLNYDGMSEAGRKGSGVELAQEVVREAIKLGDENINTRYPMQGWTKVKKFLINMPMYLYIFQCFQKK